jgi:hypothetical protein
MRQATTKPHDLGFTLMFAGNRNDLGKGSFDLKVWLRRMGRQPALDKLEAQKLTIWEE